uniref:Synaptosome associated protein 23.1 n=1 Tax=Neogobius melanostomus TaxID=47308 RepID=A0A8C6TLA1_9GOBI
MDDMTVEQMTMRANQVTDESLESTRRMLQLAEESKQTGVNTMVMLDQQGEQLRRAEEGMDQINQDMKMAEKNLTDLSKCWGCACAPVTGCRVLSTTLGTSAPGASTMERTTATAPRWCRDNPLASATGRRDRSTWPLPRPPDHTSRGKSLTVRTVDIMLLLILRVDSLRITNDAREDEMEENLDAVGGIIGNLKNMAMDMGNEIDKQNKHIDRITEKADMNKCASTRRTLEPTNSSSRDRTSALGQSFCPHSLCLVTPHTLHLNTPAHTAPTCYLHKKKNQEECNGSSVLSLNCTKM